MLKQMVFQLFVSMSDTESVKTYMRILKFLIMDHQIKVLVLKPGMVLAIEPMVNAGRRYVKTLADNWTVVTVDGKMCAHFEHTIAITEDRL